ncbi:hypothetical protein H8356DRAFT_1345318 [Neocallimastix lanati (nom. inval.)]|nr:hypothetical protein H8356DRAFT_1345318 [Neocallimastix sp. JGI-2020a]
MILKYNEAYRYVISAKIIDQLEEFNIQPYYERICRALYNCAKTPSQLKLLWGSVLQSAENKPDNINSSHVIKMWKKLCRDKKYSKICHYEDEIINKVEVSLNKRSKEIRHSQLNKNNEKINDNKFTKMNYYSNNGNLSQSYPSPILNIPTISSNIPMVIPNESIEYKSSLFSYPSPISSKLTISLNDTLQHNHRSTSYNIYKSNVIAVPSNPNITVTGYPIIKVQYPFPSINH